uniref:TERF1-interacting nuclear factor 2 N-terminal domain-containing protein n=1 Tax=Anabas testudineus TaxID=64144 RepID=A0A3Q1HC28_ANATE
CVCCTGMATRKPNDGSLPFAALQLLSPPLRLVSAAIWKVMKTRDIMQYGVVEEFVTSACETVPGLLTVRHQGKLALGLRARVRFYSPLISLCQSCYSVEQFFKEKFPVEYGPTFDKELEKLMWEFLIRLDQLLPVPSLAQTVSWLSGAPPVLEECAQAATQPQLLKILLQHQTCLGHLEPAASLPPNMGDSILDSLSLPLSGRVPSDQPTETKRSAVEQPGGAQRRDNTPFITPVIGLISNEDVPVMNSTSRRTVSSKDATNDSNENLRFTVVNQKQQSKDDEGQEAEEELSGKKRISRVRQGRGGQRTDKKKEEGAKTVRNEECNTAVLSTCMTKLGVGALHLPEDPSLSSIYASCLSSQPRVIIEKLSVASVSADRPGRRGKYSHEEQQSKRRNSPIKTVAHKSRNSHASYVLTLAPPGDGEDYVADSEDEVTKNFKGRLFVKRYYKTKHGTYVPTLREFWKPGMTRRNLLSASSTRR